MSGETEASKAEASYKSGTPYCFMTALTHAGVDFLDLNASLWGTLAT
jgi:hypothetical protein